MDYPEPIPGRIRRPVRAARVQTVTGDLLGALDALVDPVTRDDETGRGI